MFMIINAENFFYNYILKPLSCELSTVDKAIALICSVVLGIFSLGFCHLFCYLKYRKLYVVRMQINHGLLMSSSI